MGQSPCDNKGLVKESRHEEIVMLVQQEVTRIKGDMPTFAEVWKYFISRKDSHPKEWILFLKMVHGLTDSHVLMLETARALWHNLKNEMIDSEYGLGENGWCPICKKGTECGQTYCDEHKPDNANAKETL